MSVGGELARERRTFWLGAIGCVVASTAVIFNRVVFAGEWFSARDSARVYMPLAKYWADRVRAGGFPEWYPYDALGQPFVEIMFSAAFHPARLLYLVLPLEHAHSVNLLLCYPAAAAGAYLCARALGMSRHGALFAAISFAFSGYLVGISNNLAYLVSISTMPAALWAADRFVRAPSAARLTASSVLLALIAFSGEVQTFALTSGAVLLVPLFRRSDPSLVRRVALGAAIVLPGALIACPQLLPALGTIETRGNLNPLWVATKFSLHPLRLLELPFGPIFISENLGNISQELRGIVDPRMKATWVDSIAVGLPSFTLAALGAWAHRRVPVARALFVLAAILLLLMLGQHLPLYALFYRFVPLWSVFRYPEKLAPWLTLILALGAGAAVSRAADDPRLCRRAAGALLVAGGCGLLLTVVAGAGAWPRLLASSGVPAATHPPLTRWLIANAAGVLTATALMAAVLWRLREQLRWPAVIALQAALLVWLGLPLPETTELPLVRQPSGFAEMLLERGAARLGGPRLHAGSEHFGTPNVPGLSAKDIVAFGTFSALSPNIGGLYGLDTTNNYLPAGSARLIHTALLGNRSGDWTTTFAPLYGAEYLVASQSQRHKVERFAGLEVLAENDTWQLMLLRLPTARPRVYLARPRCVPDLTSAIALIQTTGFRPEVEALVECGRAEPTPGPSVPPGEAAVQSYAPERIAVDVQATEPAMLVLNDAWFRGWTAAVDGSPAPIEPVNGVVRGVRVPQGAHRVTFSYRQPGLREGLLIAALTLFALAAAAMWERRGRRAPRRAGDKFGQAMDEARQQAADSRGPAKPTG